MACWSAASPVAFAPLHHVETTPFRRRVAGSPGVGRENLLRGNYPKNNNGPSSRCAFVHLPFSARRHAGEVVFLEAGVTSNGVFARPSVNYRNRCSGITRAAPDEYEEVVNGDDGATASRGPGEKVIDETSQHEERGATLHSTRPSSALFDDGASNNDTRALVAAGPALPPFTFVAAAAAAAAAAAVDPASYVCFADRLVAAIECAANSAAANSAAAGGSLACATAASARARIVVTGS